MLEWPLFLTGLSWLSSLLSARSERMFATAVELGGFSPQRATDRMEPTGQKIPKDAEKRQERCWATEKTDAGFEWHGSTRKRIWWGLPATPDPPSGKWPTPPTFFVGLPASPSIDYSIMTNLK